MKKLIISKILFIFLLLCCIGMTAQEAKASHLRGVTMSWAPTGILGEVEFRFLYSERGGTRVVGSLVSQTITFGDGTSGTATGPITSVNTNDDYFVADLKVKHLYAGNGPYLAFYSVCCRISTIRNSNDQNIQLQTMVTPRNGNKSPVVSIPPVITVPVSGQVQFGIPASDADGDRLRFRLATVTEAGGVGNTQPSGLSVDANTGLVTWNTAGLNPQANHLFTTQIMVEDLDANGVVISKVPVDFIIKFVANVGSAPTLTINPAGPLTVSANTPVTFTVTGNDVDANSRVTLNAAGIPSGATMSPALGAQLSPPVTSTFNWTPTLAQAGPTGNTYVINFTATDDTNQQALRSITINVLAVGAPTASSQSIIASAGVPQSVVLKASDPNGLNLSFAITASPGHGTAVLNGSPSCSVSFGTSTCLQNATYTATAGYAGTDVFTFRANNGVQNSNAANVSITIASKTQAVATAPDSGGVYNGGVYTGNGSCSNGLSPVIAYSGGSAPVNAGTSSYTVTCGDGGVNYIDGTATGSIVITQASSVTTVSCPASAVYTGSALELCTAGYTTSDGQNGSLAVTYSNNTNVGTAGASASYGGDSNHAGSTGSGTFEITQASSVVIVSCPTGTGAPPTTAPAPAPAAAAAAAPAPGGPPAPAPGSGSAAAPAPATQTASGSVTYTGVAQTPCTASYSTSDGQGGSLSVSYSNNTDVGTAGASASYGGDANHSGSSGASSFTISRASTTVTVTVSDVTYDGDPHGGTAAVTGVNDLNETLVVTYVGRNLTTYAATTDAPTAAGDYTASASYAGSDNYETSEGSKDYSIGKASSTTTVTCDAGPFVYSGSAFTPCSALVTGAGTLSQVATVTYSNNTNAGTATASAAFDGDDNHFSSNGSAQFEIAKAEQSINFAAVNNTTFGASDFTINATATSGLTVSLTVVSGNCTLSSPTSPSNVHITGAGSCSITASQGGNGNFNSAVDVTRTFNIAKATQVITFALIANMTFGDADFDVSATGGGSGNAVTFAATGNCTVSGNTVHITAAGSCTITASQTGNSNYDPAADVSRSFNIAKAASAVTVSAPPFISNGGSVTISGVLTGVSNAPLGGQSVTFSIGSGTGTQTCMGTTNASGAASCTIMNVNQPTGPGLAVTATFGGNSNYNGSGASTTTFVYGYAAGGGGAFVIGDRNAAIGTNVTYWGAQWANLNSLTGGSAANAFKGFANRSSATPASSGAVWTTDPGNSSNPPASVPAYMAVIVSSNVTKSGSTISGNTVKMVIVRTNPGYQANPGNAGTGTVVAVLP